MVIVAHSGYARSFPEAELHATPDFRAGRSNQVIQLAAELLRKPRSSLTRAPRSTLVLQVLQLVDQRNAKPERYRLVMGLFNPVDLVQVSEVKDDVGVH